MGEEVTITFETLYELYRREKDRAELQELPASFFSDVANYLAEKETAVHPAQGSIFDNETEKARIQIDNVRKILKTLYDRRESKILDMAMVKARTQSIINTQSLLDPEKDLYTSVVGILNMYRGGVLQRLIMGSNVRVPQRNTNDFSPAQHEAGIPMASAFSSPSSMQSPPDHFPSTCVVQSSISPSQQSEVQVVNPSQKPEEPQISVDQRCDVPWPAGRQHSASDPPDQPLGLPSMDSKTVRFLCAVPKFVGPNLEVYGPFSENDTATLPEPIVNVLLSKGRVEAR